MKFPEPALKCRFIPTAVGNALVDAEADEPIPVHPHGCGERRSGKPSRPDYNGSSPRLWGTHACIELQISH